MRVIALTGGLATGKSTVAAMLAARGAEIIDSDLLAREVVATGTPGYYEVVDRFGREILTPEGHLDRVKLGAMVFGDVRTRQDLQEITHPKIRELTTLRLRHLAESDTAVAILDIPLLFETARHADFPETVLVYASEATQRTRLRERDGLNPDEIEARLHAQLPIESKRTLATWVINNDSDLVNTETEVALFWKKITDYNNAAASFERMASTSGCRSRSNSMRPMATLR